MLLTDSPIVRRGQDELDTATFVARLVRPLVEAPPNESLVVGLYGPWGHGKSSALNLLHEVLRETSEGAGSITVRFNPWLYTDAESLLLSFFGTLRATIGGSSLLSSPQKAKLRRAISSIATFATPALKLSPLPAAVATAVEGGLKGVEKLLEGGETDYLAQKKAVATILSSLAKRDRPMRVVVLIDDLDRAQTREIETVLRLVKLIADLPNISYVLSMDDRRVRAALSQSRSDGYGADYLEKIVQVAVYLPPVRPETLQQLVLSAVIAELEKVGLDGSRLTKGQYEGGVDYYRTFGRRVRTLRDRARLVNTLRFVLSTGERTPDLNGSDIALLCFLQTFFPDVYDAIRFNRRFLLGVREGYEGLFGSEDEKKRVDAERIQRMQLIAGYDIAEHGTPADRARTSDDAATAMTVLRLLFPYAELGRDRDADDKARVENRIRSGDRFDAYFQLAPLPHEVPDADVVAVIAALNALPDTGGAINKEDVGRLLGRFADTTEPFAQQSFIEKFVDRLELLEGDRAHAVGLALLPLEAEIGSVRLIGLVMAIVRQLSTPRRIGDEVEVLDLDRPAELAVSLVTALSDAPKAVDVANDIIRDAYSIQFNEEQKRSIAEAGVARVRLYVTANPDLFADLGPIEALELVWNWFRLAEACEHDGTELRLYLSRLLGAHPERAGDVISLGASWSLGDPPMPHFGRRQPPANAFAALANFVDVDQLLVVARMAYGLEGARYLDLTQEFIEYADLRSASAIN